MTRQQATRLNTRNVGRITKLRAEVQARVVQIAALEARMARSHAAMRWRPPNDPTAAAKQVWRAVYPRDPWPAGWRVAWAGFMPGCAGLCVHDERRIVLSYGDARARTGRVVETLVHEFIHLRAGPALRHGKDFRRLLTAARSRLGLGPLEEVAGDR
jgi:hypothetical protein